MKEAFFKHGEKDALRSCVKAINFCSTESQGELRDFAEIKMKELEDELIAKIKSAIIEVAVNFYAISGGGMGAHMGKDLTCFTFVGRL